MAKHLVCTENKCCPGLQHVFTENNRKGINQLEVMDIKTGDNRIAGVMFKKTDKDKGILFNYCPFCGESLRLWEDVPPVMEVPINE